MDNRFEHKTTTIKNFDGENEEVWIDIRKFETLSLEEIDYVMQIMSGAFAGVKDPRNMPINPTMEKNKSILRFKLVQILVNAWSIGDKIDNNIFKKAPYSFGRFVGECVDDICGQIRKSPTTPEAKPENGDTDASPFGSGEEFLTLPEEEIETEQPQNTES